MDISMIDRFAFRTGLLIAALLLCDFPALASLQRIEITSVVVIRGTSPHGFARDCVDDACTSGPVAKAIAAALKNPNTTIAKFFDEVNIAVLRSTDATQSPTITASQPIDVPLKGTDNAAARVSGNGAYAHFNRLQGSPRDAELVGKSFSDIGFRTRTVIDAKPTVLKKALEDFLSDLKPDDVAVLYYSGHGFSLDGVEYLPALDGEISSASELAGSSMPISSLMEALAESKAGKKILILDTHFPEARPSINR
jgi:hypothetical protein